MILPALDDEEVTSGVIDEGDIVVISSTTLITTDDSDGGVILPDTKELSPGLYDALGRDVWMQFCLILFGFWFMFKVIKVLQGKLNEVVMGYVLCEMTIFILGCKCKSGCCGVWRRRRGRSVRYEEAPILRGSVDGMYLGPSSVLGGSRRTGRSENLEMSVLNGEY